MSSASWNSLSVFYFLLSQPGIDLNIIDGDGETALHNAVDNGNEEMVRVLANKRDMNLDIKNKKGKTAKDIASSSGLHDLVDIIEEAEKNKKTASQRELGLPSQNEGLMKVAFDVGAMEQEDELKDLTIVCNKERIKCHKFPLVARSSVFKTTFTSNMEEKSKNEIKIKDSTPEAVKTMLNYIYTGQVTNIGNIVADVIQLADKYDLSGLQKICEKTLLDDLVVENCINSFILVDRYKSPKIVRDKVIQFFKDKSLDVVKTGDWKKAMGTYPDLITELVTSLVEKK